MGHTPLSRAGRFTHFTLVGGPRGSFPLRDSQKLPARCRRYKTQIHLEPDPQVFVASSQNVNVV
jgi:hypothetical protein